MSKRYKKHSIEERIKYVKMLEGNPRFFLLEPGQRASGKDYEAASLISTTSSLFTERETHIQSPITVALG